MSSSPRRPVLLTFKPRSESVGQHSGNLIRPDKVLNPLPETRHPIRGLVSGTITSGHVSGGIYGW
jgi:hypothetical protein